MAVKWRNMSLEPAIDVTATLIAKFEPRSGRGHGPKDGPSAQAIQ